MLASEVFTRVALGFNYSKNDMPRAVFIVLNQSNQKKESQKTAII